MHEILSESDDPFFRFFHEGALSIRTGYGHWADSEDLTFCSDEHLIEFFKAGSKKYGPYKMATGPEKMTDKEMEYRINVNE